MTEIFANKNAKFSYLSPLP